MKAEERDRQREDEQNKKVIACGVGVEVGEGVQI